MAALNHPHICQLDDIGPNYLVMAFIEGAELARLTGRSLVADSWFVWFLKR